jgi:hypothetical protein
MRALKRALDDLDRAALDYARELEAGDEPLPEAWRWIEDNRWINGRKWSWEASGPRIDYGKHDARHDRLPRPYLKKPVGDDSQEKAVEKCRQAEMTTAGVNEQLYLVCNRPHTNTLHVFPTATMGREVSRAKIAPAISGSPRVKDRITSMAVFAYTFDIGSIYSVTGARGVAGGRALSQDLVLYDEWDQIPSAIEGVFDQQMSHSALQLKRKISTPTTPGVGIDAEIKRSSDCRWLWRCASCGEEQEFSWPENCINHFDLGHIRQDSTEHRQRLDEVFWGCRKCGSYVDRCAGPYTDDARWVASDPTLEGLISGYTITAAMIPWKTAREVLRWEHKLRDFPVTFRNEVWGGAARSDEGRLTEEEVRACCRRWRSLSGRTAALDRVAVGIDQGLRESWAVVSARGQDGDRSLRCIVAAYRIDADFLRRNGINPDDHDAHARAEHAICERFGASIVVCDANGIGADRFVYLLNKMPQVNRVWGAFFDTKEKEKQLRPQSAMQQSKLLVPLWNAGRKHVTFSKVNALRQLQGEYRRRRTGLFAEAGEDAEIVRVFIAHHTAQAVQKRYDFETGREYDVAVKMAPDDHLLEADYYSMIGDEKLGGFGTVPMGIGAMGEAL